MPAAILIGRYMRSNVSRACLRACARWGWAVAELPSVARMCPSGSRLVAQPKWINYHIALNSISALLIVITFALGMASIATSVPPLPLRLCLSSRSQASLTLMPSTPRRLRSAGEGTQFAGPDSDLHHKLGLALLLIVLFEAALGLFARSFPTRAKNEGRLHPVRAAHWAGGILASGLLYWLIWDGVYTEWAGMSTSMTQS